MKVRKNEIGVPKNFLMPPWRVSFPPWAIRIFLELWGVDLRGGHRCLQAMVNKMSVLTVLSQHAHGWGVV